MCPKITSCLESMTSSELNLPYTYEYKAAEVSKVTYTTLRLPITVFPLLSSLVKQVLPLFKSYFSLS